MGNKPLNTDVFDRAAKFAIDAHHNTERRGKGFPYIIHAMEAAEIVSRMTTDQELLAAAMLHDVLEDTDVTEEELRKAFGDRITELVLGESDQKVPDLSETASWVERKKFAIDRLKTESREAKMVALGDKLSNMRAIARDYEEKGDALWAIFHAPEPKLHRWHYEGLLDSLSELEGEGPYEEFKQLVHDTFSKAFPE